MKIGIIDNSPVYRKGIKNILSGVYPDLIFSEFLTIDNYVSDENSASLDLIMAGVTADDQETIQLVKSIRKHLGNAGSILLLSTPKSDHEVVSLIAAGAQGFLTRNSIPSYLLEAVDIILFKKNIYIESQYLSRIVSYVVSPDRSPSSLNLSPRENEIAYHFARGERVKHISEKLNLKPSTVSNIKAKIFSKLQINSRSELKKVMNVSQESSGLHSYFKKELQD